MSFRPLLLCGALLVLADPPPARAAAAPAGARVLSRDASFFRAVLRHTAAVEATVTAVAGIEPTAGSADPAVERDRSRTAEYVGGAALLGLAAYFIASSGGDDLPFAPKGDDIGDADLPSNDPFVPPGDLPGEPGNPGQPGQPGDPGQPGQPGGDGELEPDLEIVPDPTTVTPEPVSMTLMATGLAGMGVASLRRRMRRRS